MSLKGDLREEWAIYEAIIYWKASVMHFMEHDDFVPLHYSWFFLCLIQTLRGVGCGNCICNASGEHVDVALHDMGWTNSVSRPRVNSGHQAASSFLSHRIGSMSTGVPFILGTTFVRVGVANLRWRDLKITLQHDSNRLRLMKFWTCTLMPPAA